MLAPDRDAHHIPGYTGFLPGGQHQMAKTYGNVSKATLAERQANDDPLKWRKFVSYAEFTPPKTPAEGHFIPGYSGNVAGVYSENLFAKTYGKTTLQAVSGDYPKGQIYTTEEQYKSTSKVLLGDVAGHPGKPNDITVGGSSWSGASPYNIRNAENAPEVCSANPWPPSTVQIAGGKEPVGVSQMLRNFPAVSETTEPALRIMGKTDPHDPLDPEKKTMSQTSGNFQIPGYSGFVPGVQSENLFAGTFARTTSEADTIRDRKKDEEVHLHMSGIQPDGILPLDPPKPPPVRSGDMATTAVDGPQPHAKHIPGYTGFVPGVEAESIFGHTYGHASHIAISGEHKRFQWKEQEVDERFFSSSKSEFLQFGHPAKIDDGHITYAHETSNPAKANFRKKKVATIPKDFHIPGYGGFVPGVQARNMFGSTQYKETGQALAAHDKALKAYDLVMPKTGALASDKPDLGMLQFVPEGFMYQKRMQGEWNGGMLGSRNYSAVRLSEGRHWKGNLYTTTNKELMKGHSNDQAPKIFSKGPEPTFENMNHALAHKSVYLGYQAM